jgi:hypothetical protein
MLELDVDTKACAARLAFFQFLFKAGFLVGGRITVMVDPAKSDSIQGDKIIAGALWLPPRSRLAIWMVPTMLKAGAMPMLKRWGLTGLLVHISNIFKRLHCLQYHSANCVRISSNFRVNNAQDFQEQRD